jgi:hypothetical protein
MTGDIISEFLEEMFDDMARGLSGPPDKAGRRRRTRAQIDQLDRQIIAELKADHPQSCRHVYYRMTNPRLPEPVEKSDRGSDQIGYRLKQLRLSGAVPYGWISDTTRRGYHVNTYDSAADFIRRVKGLYRADLWAQADYYVEVWAESRSIAGVIQADCEELAVSLYPSGGFTSMTLAYEAGIYIKSVVEQTGKVPVILYIGDYDPAGVLIDRDIKAKLSVASPSTRSRSAPSTCRRSRATSPSGGHRTSRAPSRPRPCPPTFSAIFYGEKLKRCCRPTRWPSPRWPRSPS